MRYSPKFIKARFAAAMEAIGAPHGDIFETDSSKAIVGTFFIDHAPIYGGYKIRKIASVGGAESEPFGSSRYSAKEFVAFLDGMLGAAHIIRTAAK